MTYVTQELAERIAGVARLLGTDDTGGEALESLTRLGVETVPGAAAAAVTIAAGERALTFAASDPRVEKLHELQFTAGEGPAVETMRHNETRHAPDFTTEPRWRPFCRAAAAAGFASCMTLPLHTNRQPAGAVALYGERAHAFSGAAHDIALLFAAQGGTALHNAEVYGACRQMVANLQSALESRAVIEQAKGVLHAELGISPGDAFSLLNRASQNSNQKVRALAAALVTGDLTARQLQLQAGLAPGRAGRQR